MAGSQRFTGAAALAIGGALRGGAGMVRLVSAGTRWPWCGVQLAGGGDHGDRAEPAGERRRRPPGRVQAWVAGPGMGTDERRAERLAAVLASDLPVLVDADGLTLLAADRGLLDRAAPTLLTPHAGELARLLGVRPGRHRGAARWSTPGGPRAELGAHACCSRAPPR